MATGLNAYGASPAGYSEYYVPGETEQLFDIFVANDNDPVLDAASGMHTVIAITASADNTQIYYDHWEDGYDFDPDNPAATADESYTLTRGQVLEFESGNIPVPRGSAEFYDGRDRFFVAGGATSVTRATWPESIGTIYALTWELYPTKPFLNSYTIPVGENLAAAPTNYADFSNVFVLVQATEDNTHVVIDDPSTAVVDVDTFIDAGEVAQLNNIDAGTQVTTSSPVQVQLIVGRSDPGGNSQARGMSLVPNILWENEYYSPVGGFASRNTDIFVFNPQSTAITVDYQDSAGSGSFSLAAGATLAYSDASGANRFVPEDSAVYLSASDVFWGIVSADTESAAWDWGFSLVPTSALTDEYFLGWAPGTSSATPTANGSPAFITPLQDGTRIFIDYSPADGTFDESFDLDRLESRKVFDPDNENTGMRIVATGTIAVAWGEDPNVAGSSSPYLDLGYSVVPLAPDFMDLVLAIDKTASPEAVPPGGGETVRFTLAVDSGDTFGADDVNVVDDLPAGWTYQSGTSVITLPGGATLTGAAADPVLTNGGQTLTWNLLQDMTANQSLTVEFDAQTSAATSGLAFNVGNAEGTRQNGGQTFSTNDIAFIEVTPLVIDKTSDAGGAVNPGDTVTYTIDVSNPGSTTVENVVLRDVLPPGVSYVAGSSEVTYPAQIVTPGTYTSPDLGPDTFNGTGTLTQQFDTTGLIPVDAVITSYSFTVAGEALSPSWLSEIGFTANYPGGTAFNLPAGSFASGNNPGAYNVSDSSAAVSGSAEGIYQFNWTESFNDGGDGTNDNQINTATFSIGYDLIVVSSTTYTTQPAGTPPELVTAADQVILPPGTTMTVTFEVTVDDPLNSSISAITNTAAVTADGAVLPLTASVTDLTPLVAGIVGTVWLDVDGDGANDVGEAGIGATTVFLCAAAAPSCDASTGVVVTATTDINGGYSFAGLAPGSYQVQVDQSDVDLAGLQPAPGNSGGNSGSITLIAGQSERQDFGYLPTGGAVIEGSVWSDADADTLKEAGEAGIGAVTVTLFNSDGTATGISTVTAADGSYRFTGIAAGEYNVRVDEADTDLVGFCNPTAVATCATTATASTPLNVTANSVVSEVDFGFAGASTFSLSDAIWYDGNANGVFQSNGADGIVGNADDENGIANVTVELVDAGGQVVASTSTGNTGEFTFSGLVNGNYTVRVSDSGGELNGFTETTATGGSTTQLINGASIDRRPSNGANPSFGYHVAKSLGGVLWSDADGDGAQDADETGFTGVAVYLCRDPAAPCAPASPNFVAQTTTASDGSYRFSGLDNDDYLVAVSAVPSGSTATGDPDEGGTCSVCDGQTTTAVTLSGNQSLGQIDFGYQNASLSNVSGTVFNDFDRDGVSEPNGNDGIGGNGDDESGIDGVTLALQTIHGIIDGALDINGDGVINSADDGSVSAGIAGLAVIDGQLDIDGNGVIDANDDGTLTGLAVVDGGLDVNGDATVDGSDDGVIAGDPVATVVSDGSGGYVFTDVPDGNYQVAVSDDAMVLDGLDISSGLDQLSVTADSAAGDVTGVDFGYAGSGASGSIASGVWIDADGDGVRDAVETDLSGITVNLLDCGADGVCGNGDDGGIIDTAVTDPNGDVVFANLLAGTYQLDLDEASLANGGSGLDEISNYLIDPNGSIALSTGERYRADFGYLPVAGQASLNGVVWFDANSDGSRDAGEAGLGAIDITVVPLFQVIGGAIDLNNNGAIDTDGGDDGTLAGFSVVNGEVFQGGSPFTGTINTVAIIAGRVDSTGNGVVNGSDNGLIPDAAVTVGTGPDGAWSAAVAAGDYYVSYNSADGDFPSGMVTAAPTNMPAGDDRYQLNDLADGASVGGLDFGFAGAVSGGIDGVFYLDKGADGSYQPNGNDGNPATTADNDTGLANVTLNLVDGSGAIVASTTTGADGSFSFSAVPPGSGYEIVTVDAQGVLNSLNSTETLPGSYDVAGDGSVSNVGGDGDGDRDAGYSPESTLGSIGGTVWLDLDQNGYLNQSSEPGLANVTVECWLDVDSNGTLEPGTDNLIRTETTNAAGEFFCDAVPGGYYLTRVTDELGVLAGTTSTHVAAGSDAASYSDVDGAAKVDDYALLTTMSNFSADFGRSGSLTISGTVFDDANPADAADPDNGNGAQDPNEPGVDQVVVTIFRVLSNGTRVAFGSTTTPADGSYSFGDLPPGDYEIEIDTAASSVSGYSETTASGGVLVVNGVTASLTGQNFGFEQVLATTPVTLSYFEATWVGDELRIDWATATETGNLGFDLYAELDGDLLRINEQLIRSQVIDSTEPQRYGFNYPLDGALLGDLTLVDIDTRGRETRHGPFEPGRAYGRVEPARRIDWAAINAEHVRKRKAKRARSVTPTARQVKLLVDRDGLYRVSHAELSDAGLDLSGVGTDDLGLSHLGQAIPISVIDNDGNTADGSDSSDGTPGGGRQHEGSDRPFGPGDSIEFIGQATDSIYTMTAVYLLSVDNGGGARVQQVTAGPGRQQAPVPYYMATAELADQRRYSFSAPGADPWYLDRLLATGEPVSRDFSFELDQRVTAATDAVQLTVDLWGVTDFPETPDHHVVAAFNDVVVASARFDGLRQRSLNATVASDAVRPGTNTVTLSLPHDSGVAADLVNLERIRIRYPRAFVARNDRLEFDAAGRRFDVSGLTSDDVVVYRRLPDGHSQRLATRIVADGDSYRVSFRGNQSTARYFVATAGSLLSPRLETLSTTADQAVGGSITGTDASYLIIAHADFIGAELERLVEAREAAGYQVAVVDVDAVYAGFGHHQPDAKAIDSYIAYAFEHLGTRSVLLVGGDSYDYHDRLGLGTVSFIPSLYGRTNALVSHAPLDALYADIDDDGVPDVAIGRWPVRSSAELTRMIDQTLAYQRRPYGRSAVFAADDFDQRQGYDFVADSEAIIERLPFDWQIERAYLDGNDTAAARSTLIGAINRGVSLTSFVGHSGPRDWTFDGLLRSSDVDSLSNSGLPTVVTQWGCWNTYYVDPAAETLGHRFLLAGDRGAAAVLGASTLTSASAEAALAQLVFEQLMIPGTTLGEAVLAAKQTLALTQPDQVDVILGWTLLGDPALVIEP